MHGKRGYTIIELLVVLAVVGIAASIAVPAWRQLDASSRLGAHVALYAQALHTARTLAVSSGRHVSLCPLDANGRCDGNWDQDLTLFYDDARRGELVEPGDAIALVAIPGNERMDVRWNGFGERRFLNVRSTGRYRQNGRFRFCPHGQVAGSIAQGRAIVVNVTGRTRVEKTTCP